MYDCIVVGAGYAGLSAALHLKAAGKQVLVLEAGPRVGGRVHTYRPEQQPYLDLGAAWVGPSQHYILDLLKSLHIEVFAQYDTGKSILHTPIKQSTYKGIIPPLPIYALLSLDFAIKKLNRLSKKINLEAPWLSPNAQKLDAQSLADWMHHNMGSATARDFLKLASEAIWAADPSEISLLHALFYIKSGRDLDTLMNIKNGAQAQRVSGGLGAAALKMADLLGASIKLNSPVLNISQSDSGVEITGQGFSYQAIKAIIALPPIVASKLCFAPKLPLEKQTLLASLPMGKVWKTYAVYDKPFWRSKGLSGLVAATKGMVRVCFDTSPVDGGKGILMGFVLADQAATFSGLSDTERKQEALNAFEAFFGAEARQYIYYKDFSFTNEPFAQGCYAGLMPKNLWTSHGSALRTPTGHLHWAGTETATQWMGYVDGAISSGIRAADEILSY
jgi:monoamine oxidase